MSIIHHVYFVLCSSFLTLPCHFCLHFYSSLGLMEIVPEQQTPFSCAKIHLQMKELCCWFISVSPNQNARPCKKPCSLRTSCSNCTSNGMECMWCSSTKRCVDSNAYIISFPYGQCLEWQTATCSRKCLCTGAVHSTATSVTILRWAEELNI